MTTDYPTDTCRGCGRAMIWTTSPKGRPLPLDARPSATIPDLKLPIGLYRIEPEGDHRNARLMAVSVAGVGQTSYVSHFATCPARDRFKGKNR